jgi:hypothetical protein
MRNVGIWFEHICVKLFGDYLSSSYARFLELTDRTMRVFCIDDKLRLFHVTVMYFAHFILFIGYFFW